ncbi:PEGA domain-containing protein [Saliphagus sp. GCM10025334]
MAGRASIRIEVREQNSPTIEITNPEQRPTVDQGEEVTFTADIEAPDGELDRVDWYVDGEFIERTSASGSSDSVSWRRTFDDLGAYNIGAVVYDESGQSAEVAWIVTVEEPEPPTVSTGSAESVDEKSATLVGALEDKGSDDGVEVWFRYRPEGADDWQTTQRGGASGFADVFDYDVDGLEPGTTYEFQAIAETSVGTDTGEVETFRTDDPEPGTVFVTVSDEGTIEGYEFVGEPIEGATVQLGDETAETGEDGRARFELEPGEHDLVIHADGYGTTEFEPITVQSGSTRDVSAQIVPEDTGVLEIEVLDEAGETVPLYEYRVLVDGEDVELNRKGQALVDAGERTVAIEPREGYDVEPVETDVTVEENRTTEVEFDPRDPDEVIDLEFTVVDEDGEPVADAEVILYEEDWDEPKVTDQRKVTDEEGVVEWEMVPAGAYRVEAYVGDEFWHSSEQTAAGGETLVVDLERNMPYVEGFDVEHERDLPVAGEELTLTPRVVNADWYDNQIDVTVYDEDDQVVETTDGLTVRDPFSFVPEELGEYCIDSQVDSYIEEDWTPTADQSPADCITVYDEDEVTLDIDIEVGHEETYTGSKVAMRVEAPQDGLEYEWTIAKGDDAGELLHESGEHTTLTVREAGEYVVRVEAEQDNESTLIGETETITATNKEIVDLDADVMELAEQYAPILHFHSDEEFFPTRYEGYLENSELNGVISPTENPSLLDLVDSGGDIDPGTFDIETLKEFQDPEVYPETVYTSVHSNVTYDDEEYVAIGYWMVYVHDPKPSDVRGTLSDRVAAHTGDQEPVFILLDESGPQYVASQQHKGGEIRPWEQVPKTGERIHIYPAEGAHSNFFEPYSGSSDGEKLTEPPNEFDARHLYQAQYLFPSYTSTEIHERIYRYSWYADPIGNDVVWNPEEGDYEIILLTDAMAWAEYEGNIYTFRDTDRANLIPGSDYLFGSDIPMQQNRWEELDTWIDDNIAESHEQFDGAIYDPNNASLSGILYDEYGPEHFDPDIHRTGEDIQADLGISNTGPQPAEFVVSVTAVHESGTVQTVEHSIFFDTGNVGFGPVIVPEDWHDSSYHVPLFPPPADDVETGNWMITIELASYTADISTDDDVHDELVFEYEHEIEVDATVEFVDVSEGEVASGEAVESTAVVNNTGEQEHTFFVGYGAVDPDGETYDNNGTTGTTVTLEPGETAEVELEWIVEEGAPEGLYDLGSAVWLESDRDELQTRLDEDQRNETIEVVGTDVGQLHVESEPLNATVEINGEVEGQTPLTVNLEEGTYDLVVDAPDHEPEELTATVTAGETENVSVELEPEPVEPPEADLEAEPDEAAIGEEVLLDASGTEDPNDLDLIYHWDITGDGEIDIETVEPTVGWEFEEAGEYIVSVEVDNGVETDTAETTVTVTEPDRAAEFVIEHVETNDPVEVGDVLEVTAVVTNEGDEDGIRDVTLEVDGQESTSEEVELESGEETTIELTYETGSEDTGEVEITIGTGDDEESTTVEVLESRDLEIRMEDRTGDGTDDVWLSNGRVWFQMNDEDLESRTFISALGRTGSDVLAGPWQFRPRTPDGHLQFDSTRAFEIVEDGDDVVAYSVVREYTIDDVPFRMTHTAALTAETDAAIVETEWTNLGSDAVQFDQPPGHVHDGAMLVRGVDLAGQSGEYRFHVSETGTHSFDGVRRWQTFDIGGDLPFVTVFDDDHAATYALLEGATGPRHAVTNGQPADRVDLMVQEVTVEPDDTVTYTTAIAAHDGGDSAIPEAEALVTDAAAIDLPVEPPRPDSSTFTVEISDTTAPIETGDTLDVTAEIENAGDTGATEEVVLDVGDKTGIDETTVELDSGETETVTLSHEIDESGEFDVVVRGADDEDSTRVTVDEAAEHGVEFHSCTEVEITGDFEGVHLEASYLSGATDASNYLYGSDLLSDDGTTSIDVYDHHASETLFYIDYVRLSEDTDIDPMSTSDEIDHTVENPIEKSIEGCIEHDTGERPEASISFADQTSDGETVTVDSVSLSHGGFVTVYDGSEDSMLSPPAEEWNLQHESMSRTVVGASEYLEPGSHDNVEIELDELLDSSRDLVAIPHHDSTGTETYEFVESGGHADWLYYSRPPYDYAFISLEGREADFEVEFPACTRVEVTGTFEDGDHFNARQSGYAPSGVATWHEYGIAVGDGHGPDAPFTGTIVLEVTGDPPSDEPIEESDDRIVYEIGPREVFGTMITGVWTPSGTEPLFEEGRIENPNIDECRDEIRPERPTLSVADVETAADGGDAGNAFDVTFRYENPHDVEFATGGEFVEGSTADEPAGALEPGTHEFTVRWTPETEDERLVWVLDLEDFGHDEPVRVETEPADEYDGGDSEALEVEITGTNDPVAAGERFELTAAVTNTGDEAVTQDVQFLVGDSRELFDSETVTLDPGSSQKISLGYETYPVQQDVSFPVYVVTDDDEAAITVEVVAGESAEESPGSGQLDVTITDTNAPVDAGEYLEVTVQVENTGDADAEQSLRLIAGDEQVASRSVTVTSGETQSISLGYETYPVQQDVEFVVTVQSDDDSDSRTVTVFGQ